MSRGSREVPERLSLSRSGGPEGSKTSRGTGAVQQCVIVNAAGKFTISVSRLSSERLWPDFRGTVLESALLSGARLSAAGVSLAGGKAAAVASPAARRSEAESDSRQRVPAGRDGDRRRRSTSPSELTDRRAAVYDGATSG